MFIFSLALFNDKGNRRRAKVFPETAALYPPSG